MIHFIIFCVGLIHCLTSISEIKAHGDGVAQRDIPLVVMTDYCIENNSEHYDVDSSIKLILTNDLDGTRKDCAVTFTTTNENHQLLLTFVEMNISPNDSWKIFDSTTNLRPFTKSGLFHSYERSENSEQSLELQLDYVGGRGVLTFLYRGTPTEKYSGFTAILTVLKKPSANGTCGGQFFLCKGRWVCVPEKLQCNGYKNCGTDDPSDEEACVNLPDHTGQQDNPNRQNSAQSIGILVGGIASIVVLMVIVLVLLGIVCLRKLARQRSYAHESRRPGDDIVVDADHVPPPPLCCRRHYPCPMHSNTFLEPPPPYSEHPQHRPATSPATHFDIAPPYTPDGCDTAGLLNQSQGLSQDTPPAYRTLPPDFESATMTAAQQQCRVGPPVANIINLGSDTVDAATITTDLTGMEINGSHSLAPISHSELAPNNETPNSAPESLKPAEGHFVTTRADGQDLIMESLEPNPGPAEDIAAEEQQQPQQETSTREDGQICTHFWRNPNTTPPFKRQ